MDKTTVKRTPTLEEEFSSKSYVDNSVVEGNFLKLNQTLQKCLKISIVNDVYNLTKHERIQIPDNTK